MRIPTAMALALVPVTASAHFVYVLPAPDRSGVEVVFSDRLVPDEQVPIAKIEATRLFAVDARGERMPLGWSRGDHSLRADLPGTNPAVVGGVTDYGFAQSRHTKDKPVHLKYYPKAILGDPSDAADLRLGDVARFEILPMVRDGKLAFRAARGGQPLAGIACVVIAEGEEPQRLTTGAGGIISAKLDRPGQYGIWLKVIEPGSGEVAGKPVEEFHSIATLVFEIAPK